jgi:hypothetical protein
MCSTLMFGTLKLGLIDLQSAPHMNDTSVDAVKISAACYLQLGVYYILSLISHLLYSGEGKINILFSYILFYSISPYKTKLYQ